MAVKLVRVVQSPTSRWRPTMQDFIAKANADPFAKRWAKNCSFDFLWQIEEAGFLVSVQRGIVEKMTPMDRRLASCDFAVRGPRAVWDNHWARMPGRNFHDLIAMRTAGHITIEGNLHPFFANILYIKRLLELPRETGSRP